MIKVVNPIVSKMDRTDLAYNNCKCVCNVAADNQSSGSSWTWLPWNTCGFTCKTGDSDNYNANKIISKNG